jgi:hypothetical protein
MCGEFALYHSDIRLVQTLRLLEATMGNHPDQAAVRDVLQAISTTRDKIANLRGAPEVGE